MKHKFPLQWHKAKDLPAPGIARHGLKVFGTFICGGGSSFGYKLAGYDHLGGVEIDVKMSELYKINHNPKYLYTEDIRQTVQREDLPAELFDLDILDGSPPCSGYSMAGNREEGWGIEKQFREGQALQTLDDLFFHFIALANKLRPKCIIGENVKGLIQGNAKEIAKDIRKEFEAIGYDVQIFLLNAASMGVPQKRERIFYICRRKDLNYPPLKLEFNEPVIRFSEIENLVNEAIGKPITEAFYRWWKDCKPGCKLSSVHPEGSFFNTAKLAKNRVCPTITSAVAGKFIHYCQPNEISDEALSLICTFPLDYNFNGQEVKYVVGMSVPPIMTAQISYQLFEQWFQQSTFVKTIRKDHVIRRKTKFN